MTPLQMRDGAGGGDECRGAGDGGAAKPGEQRGSQEAGERHAGYLSLWSRRDFFEPVQPDDVHIVSLRVKGGGG